MTAQDMFKLWEGNLNDRGQLAKYCIQDSLLCNKLINKMDMLTNNIGMANVCCVPLSYIFMRGQSIKILSLVSKICRLENHLIPDVKKTSEQNISEDDYIEQILGYEGATVFDPFADIYKDDAISVLDYNSLYPISMLHKNMSHESRITDDKFLNLPDYYYYQATYRNPDKSYHTCTYAAKKDGTPAILPKILRGLLDKRKEMRNLITQTDDKFKQKILDGLQLAYKITANSLYGQTGARMSVLYCRDIAASTTSTGREMLNCAKIFVEKIIPKIINVIQNGNYSEYEQIMEKLFNRDLDNILTVEDIEELKKPIMEIATFEDRITLDDIFDDLFANYKENDDNELSINIDSSSDEDDDADVDKDIFNLKSQKNKLKQKNTNNNKKDVKTNNTKQNKKDKSNDVTFQIIPYNYLNIFKHETNKFNPKKMCIPLSRINENGELISVKNDKDKDVYTSTKEEFLKCVYDTIKYYIKSYTTNPKIIYGDTDSVFINYNIRENDLPLKRKSLLISMRLSLMTSFLLASILPTPQNMEYEKTFYPFIILTKKRYIGDKYESQLNKYTRTSMGLALKKRDYADIVKIVLGGLVRELFDDDSTYENAVDYVKRTLYDIVNDKFPISKFVISKSIKGPAMTYEERLIEDAKPKDQRYYSDRSTIVQAALADRMADRDPGNKYQSNDRIPYVFKQTKNNVKLMSDRVEDPTYLTNNNIKIDYCLYITNQIMNCTLQFLQYVTKNAQLIFDEVLLQEYIKKENYTPIHIIFEQNNFDCFDDDDEEDEDAEYVVKMLVNNVCVSELKLDNKEIKKIIKKPVIKKQKFDIQNMNIGLTL